MLSVVLSGFVLSLIAPYLYRILSDYTGWFYALFAFGLTYYFSTFLGPVTSGDVITFSYEWIPSLGINLTFIIDGLSLVFTLMITGIGGLVFAYSSAYMAGMDKVGRFYLYIVMFMASMLGLVISDNLLTLFVFWELTSITSYMLIGLNHGKESARDAALQALLVTAGGGLALLAGIVLMAIAGGTYEFSGLLETGDVIRESKLYLPVLVLFLIGAFTKSAQFPFHFWLPNAMEAPTPVSSYLHSATMVTAGVFLLARMNPILGDTAVWFYSVTLFGGITMFVGAYLSLAQTDLKRILAYTTVSALGTLVMLIGIGTTLAVKGAIAFLLVHSFYKGALFLVAGAVDHETGTRNTDKLGGMYRKMPVTAICACLAAFSMAGVPPLFGFISKEIIYEAGIQALTIPTVLTAIALVSNIMIVAAACILSLRIFFGQRQDTPKKPHEAPASMLTGYVVLAAAGLVFGLFPEVLATPVISSAVGSVTAEPFYAKLELWHGFNLVLLLSGVTLLAGYTTYVILIRSRIASILAGSVTNRLLVTEYIYDFFLKALKTGSLWQTRILQSGYLNYYIMTVTLTTVLITGYTAITKTGLSSILEHDIDVSLYEFLLIIPIVTGALIAALTSSRIFAVAALGIIGYGMALVFILFGAPDLAITQITIETLTVIIFLLVVYQLPRFSALSGRSTKIRDGIISISLGVLITTLILLIPSEPLSTEVKEYYAENSVTLAHGRNVVNVILVDFRVLDTLGETIVLIVAAVGIFALLKLILEKNVELKTFRRMIKQRVSIVLSTVSNFVLPLLIVFSIFLLFRGHNVPGGGFVGGLVAAASFTLHAIANGVSSARSKLAVDPRVIAGLGLATMVASGLIALFQGRPFMTGLWSESTVIVIGKLGTPLLFDLGVYLLVSGITLMIIFSLGEEED